MRRRALLRTLILVPLPAWLPSALAQSGPDAELALYGLPLKDAAAKAFVDAALAAGNQRLGTGPASADLVLDARGAGVPALEQLTLRVHEGRVAAVRFKVKGYGEDNAALRRLLLGKYGVPMTVGARPLSYAAFAERMAPRGGFQWHFGGGMRLVYDHPRIGDVTLSYLDDARLAALAGSPAPARGEAAKVRDRI